MCEVIVLIVNDCLVCVRVQNYEDVPNPQSFVLYGNGVPVDQPDAVVVSIGDVRGANITERFDVRLFGLLDYCACVNSCKSSGQ